MRKVTYARLHDLKLVVGGTAMPQEYPSKTKTIPDLDMFFEEGTLFITAFGKFFGVPSANIQVMEFPKPETKAPAKKPTTETPVKQ